MIVTGGGVHLGDGRRKAATSTIPIVALPSAATRSQTGFVRQPQPGPSGNLTGVAHAW